MKELKASAKRTKINGVFVLLAKLSVSSHALGYMENKINTATRFLKVSADNKERNDNIWKQ